MDEKSGRMKEAEKMERSQSSSGRKQQKRITGENKKVMPKLNEEETGPRRSRGKKQRRQFKLAPNRG